VKMSSCAYGFDGGVGLGHDLINNRRIEIYISI